MMLKFGLSVRGYEQLITEPSLARKILERLPHTLTWL